MTLLRFNEVSYTHFITSNTSKKKPLFKDEMCCELSLKDIDFYRNKLGYLLIGYVIMPDHVHLIVWWDSDVHKDLTISTVMHRIKGRSAKRISDYLFSLGGQGFHALPYNRRGIKAPSTRQEKSTRDARKVWQSSFYDFNIYSDKKLNEKLSYIHYNPVRAGLCKKPEDWKWSSYKHYASGKNDLIHIDSINK